MVKINDPKFGTGDGTQALNLLSNEKMILTSLFRQNQYLIKLSEDANALQARQVEQNDRMIELLNYLATLTYQNSQGSQ
jgi:hypothetical protein